MIFLKLTRAAKDNLKRSGWLLAELLFVFIGMYEHFSERMHEENLDDLRHKQILQALIDEFGDYEKELSDFSTWFDSYADKFFREYSMGKKPPIIPGRYGECKHWYLGGNAAKRRDRTLEME